MDFVFGGEVREPNGLPTTPGYFRTLSNAMPYVAVLLVLAAGAGLLGYIFPGGTFNHWRALGSAAGLLATYVFLDVL